MNNNEAIAINIFSCVRENIQMIGVVWLLCFLAHAQCSVAPIIHALAALPAVRETFRSRATISWLRANTRLTDVGTVDALMNTVRRKIRSIEKRISTDGMSDGLGARLETLVTKLESLQRNANLLYCLGMCEYVRSATSDYEPDFTYLEMPMKSAEQKQPPAVSAQSSGALGAPARLARLVRVLASAEPFAKLVDAHAAGDIVVVETPYYVQRAEDFREYAVFGHTKDADLYLFLDNSRHVLVPENEKETREIGDFDPRASDSYILLRDTAQEMFFAPKSMYTSEKKKLAFLRTLSFAN